jgi:hypothetical protein
MPVTTAKEERGDSAIGLLVLLSWESPAKVCHNSRIDPAER